MPIDREDHLLRLLDELSRHGIAGRLEPTNGHVRICWKNRKGEKRFIFTSKTPSDRRTWLNCRAEIRRILRADNEFELTEAPVQYQAPRDAMARIRQLEDDVNALLDMVADLARPP